MTPAEVVSDARSHLADVRVTLTGAGPRVEAWWACRTEGCRGQAIATLEPGAAPSYQRWTQRRWYRDTQPDRPTAPPALAGLLVETVPSLAPGVHALVGGSDGATLFPFEKLARSSDGGRNWTTYDIAEVDGERGYLSGAVALPDGRLLALLADWSGDTRRRPSALHHGLWVSAGREWASLAPAAPAFDPPLRVATGGNSPLVDLQASPDSGAVIWARTSDQRLYTSVDGARSFVETAAR